MVKYPSDSGSYILARTKQNAIAWHNLAEKGKWIYMSLSYAFPLPQAFKNEDILEREEQKKKLHVEIVNLELLIVE